MPRCCHSQTINIHAAKDNLLTTFVNLVMTFAYFAKIYRRPWINPKETNELAKGNEVFPLWTDSDENVRKSNTRREVYKQKPKPMANKKLLLHFASLDVALFVLAAASRSSFRETTQAIANYAFMLWPLDQKALRTWFRIQAPDIPETSLQ